MRRQRFCPNLSSTSTAVLLSQRKLPASAGEPMQAKLQEQLTSEVLTTFLPKKWV
ncbi:hypothetical protein [[Scytonema hofmanni] UTEX B 1581]|uniref:hypothetical protein n=1 Tax=[Scytonema hofmanni] UTEX B 1581 TaxID=379535 RepID=UPI0004ACBE51|nr:hypothetical protein [[Scytonema hofmanni] UTEX B 1581]